MQIYFQFASKLNQSTSLVQYFFEICKLKNRQRPNMERCLSVAKLQQIFHIRKSYQKNHPIFPSLSLLMLVPFLLKIGKRNKQKGNMLFGVR